MATFHRSTSWMSHVAGDATSKPRTKPSKKVKPILKRLSHSARGSLDLDGTWDAQDSQCQKSAYDGRHIYNSSGATRSTKDINITFDEVVLSTPVGGSGSALGGAAIPPSSATRRYHHSRSISGASHVSVATSTSSNGGMTGPPRVGSNFVHPFAQIPRGATPPVSYANSLASFVGDARDYSPDTITEDDDDEDDESISPSPAVEIQGRSSVNLQRQPVSSCSSSQTALGLCRPSLVSQKTSASLPDSNSQPPAPLRIKTTRSISNTPTLSSRLAHNSSHTDVHGNQGIDTPLSTTFSSAYPANTPSSSIGPMSPLRNSFDAGFPRLRAKSDTDTACRADQVKNARRKFEEKERAKEERYAREDIKRRERADNKRAHVAEKKAAAALKEQNAMRMRQEAAELEQAMPRIKNRRKISMTSSGRNSLAVARPSTPRNSISVLNVRDAEKFSSNNYDTVNPQSPPAFGEKAGDVHEFVLPPVTRSYTAKRKTQRKWHLFILWLKTKLLRAGRK
ncbi:chromatin assembly factor 1 subunit A [Microdochium nivale]|nr:chromatin assembly factor 1 subunit A [Microdochium nivale]